MKKPAASERSAAAIITGDPPTRRIYCVKCFSPMPEGSGATCGACQRGEPVQCPSCRQPLRFRHRLCPACQNHQARN